MKKAYINIITRNSVNNKITKFYQVVNPFKYISINDLEKQLLDFYIFKPKGALQQFKGTLQIYNNNNRSVKLFELEFNNGELIKKEGK